MQSANHLNFSVQSVLLMDFSLFKGAEKIKHMGPCCVKFSSAHNFRFEGQEHSVSVM